MPVAQMEPVTFPTSTRRLEGRWRSGKTGGAVVAPPHPEYGGRLDHPVVETLCSVLADAGTATLSFDWSGITGNLEVADADYAAALAELRRRGGTPPIIAAGYSFGAAAALRMATGVDCLLLVAPPVALLGAEELRACTQPLVVIAGDCDDYAPADLLAALVPRRVDARLTILPDVDHFFASSGALERLAQAVPPVLA